jgi:isoleucyl-tRNA synthetase
MADEKSQSNTPNFNDLEKDVLKFWDDNKIFEKSLQQTKAGEPYIFYDGPPFATGLPHYGHILGSVAKDMFGRYQTMRGRYVRRRWGWDCHGLPIENIVEQHLKISGKKQIEEIGVERFNKICRENVLKFVEEWGKTVKRIGRWVDFENSYKTMDSTYMESVWWGLKQTWDKGLIYEDRKVLLYCPRCETPISNFEVAMDNSYRDITEESVYAKFRLVPRQRIRDDLINDKTFVLAWTTTPWTLPGNTSLNIGPDIAYVMIEAENGERYILAKERLSIIDGNYEVVMEFPARSLEGLDYEPLYEGVIPDGHNPAPEGYPPLVGGSFARAHKIYLADFVTTTDGTGIVHNAAMYGEEDYQLAKEKDLPRVDMLDHKGQYLPIAPQHLRGVFFKDADKIVLADLAEKGLVYKTEHYTHSYPHCHRCGTPLFYNAIPAWFINIQKIKPQLRRLNEQEINWHPEHLKMGRFDKSMESAPDWNISRNRYWATALPFWKCQNQDCRHVVCVGSVKDLKEQATNFEQVYPNYNPASINDLDLHRPYIDDVELKCSKCGGAQKRVPEVVDCWVESGSMPFAELHYPFEHNGESSAEDFKNRFPADFVAEYIGQVRAWFYVMLVVTGTLFEHAPFKHVVTTGNILAEDGSKMSKSKNNFPDPAILMEKFGVDALRFYLMTCPVMNADDVAFSERGVQEVNRKLSLILYNVWSFYRMYEPSSVKTSEGKKPDSAHILDQWVLAKLNQTGADATKYLDSYDTVRAGKAILDFVNELSTWYVRRSRDRMKSAESAVALQTLGYVLAETAKLLAPFMPFLADFIYRDVTQAESVHLAPWTVFEAEISPVLQQMGIMRELVETGLSLRKDSNLKVRQPLAELEYHLKNNQMLSPELEAVLAEEMNLKLVSGRGDFVPKNGWVFKDSQNFKMALNTVLTEELKAEGLARELERQVQDLRKKSGLKVGDLVDVYYNTQSEALESALLNLLDRKKTFISQIAKSYEVETDFETQAEVEGQAVWIGMTKI